VNNQQLTKLYESDAHAWFFETAKAVKEGRFEILDIDNLVEELESMCRSEQNKLESFLTELFLHLLKWKYQPKRRRCASWEISIKKQRRSIQRHLKECPSLRGHLDRIVENAYISARFDAAIETSLHLGLLPEGMPFTLEEALQKDWLP
jgi:hypothetical protein